MMAKAPLKILMVCLGNICRSPLAEGIFRQKAQQAGIPCLVDSAGTGGWHIGNPPHPMSRKIAALNQIDIAGQRARRFEATDMVDFDRVFFMDRDNMDDAQKIAGTAWNVQKASLLLDALPGAKIKNVPDPYYGAEKDYHEVFELISEACDHIIMELKEFEALP